ncbi:MAG: hypothetical protein JZU58_08730 [Curvibacter lanceolatus]|uniref:hypothetical protein n=1 Tax=Curvibacter lanceolatus TaxID=86182 RepID=UPI002353346C|nr:hypothetical protein [Curvibacter lanceolatus]MBV5292427.1 hypothetical protein [Curvibacter lanceolatus]
MSLGTVQTVLTCQTSSNTDTFNICPQGQSLSTVQAYVLDTNSQALFENSVLTDYTIPGEFFALGMTVIITAWLASKSIGFLIKAIR